MSTLRKHTISFKHAFEGIAYTFKTQPNFKVHSLVAALVLFGAWFFNLPSTEIAIIIFTISLVMIAEMINTAIESVVDLITDKLQPQAKIAKDVSAGMVLVSVIFAVLIAIFIFVKYLIVN